jgi:hypothetical protein
MKQASTRRRRTDSSDRTGDEDEVNTAAKAAVVILWESLGENFFKISFFLKRQIELSYFFPKNAHRRISVKN